MNRSVTYTGTSEDMDPAMVCAQIECWPVDHASGICGQYIPHTRQWNILATVGQQERVYELASVTKILVTLVALVAVSEEAISLEDPLGPTGSTVRHILSHASGVVDDPKKPDQTPETQRIYSSHAFDILAEHITARTGIDFPAYFHQALCEPLGLTATELHSSAGFGVRSHITDLTRIAQEMLQPQLIPAELMEYTRSIQFPSLEGFVPGYGKHRPCPWALGLEYRGEKSPHWLGVDQPSDTVGHFGQSGTFMWIDDALRVFTIILTDRPFGSWCKNLWPEFNNRLYHSIQGGKFTS